MICNHSKIKIQHSLVIGCGGRGTEAAAHCRKLVLDKIFQGNKTDFEEFSPVQFISFDSTEQNLEENNQKHSLDTIKIAAESDELNKIVSSRYGRYPDNPNGVVNILKHMPDRNYARMIRGLPNSAMGNSTCPPLGAINFLGSWDRIKNDLQQILKEWKKEYPVAEFPPVRSFNESNQIFIAAGLYGGTGSGIHIHLTAMLRMLLKEMNIMNTAVYAFFILPDVVSKADNTGKRKLRANAYACLKEIDHFVSGNPLIVPMGNLQENLVISNTDANDVLFNKIFLVNDDNGISTEKLNPFEASKMIGELFFHFTSTSLGESLNQRLTDAPHESCGMLAPEPDGKQELNETRLRAYSTFGLATVRIPYDALKHNLIIDCAIETMNSCIHKPDDDSEQEKQKIESHKKWLTHKYSTGDDLLNHIEVGSTLEEELNEYLPLPRYMTDRKGSKSFSAFLKSNDLNLEEGIDRIIDQSDIHELWEEPENIKKLFSQKEESIKLFQDNLLDEKAGTDQTAKILRKIQKEIDSEIEDLTQEIKNGNPEDYKSIIAIEIEKMLSFQNQRSLPFLKSKLTIKINNNLKDLKDIMEEYRSYSNRILQIKILKNSKERLNFEINKTDEEARRFQAISEELGKMKKEYIDSKLMKNAVSKKTLRHFIHNFPYKAGTDPDDMAKKIQVNGLKITSKENKKEKDNVKIAKFPDHHPAEVASALFEMAKENIESMIPEENWERTFTQSGLYHRPGVDQNWESQGIDTQAYKKTMKSLIELSAPYLKYNASKGFDVCKETFFIYPEYREHKIDVEKLIWEKNSLPEGNDFWLTSSAAEGTFCLTCLQLHYGIPLFSVNQFDEWKEEYDKVLLRTDRPVHKFDLSAMKEPYIENLPIDENSVNQLFSWLLDEISNDLFPAFNIINTTPVLNLLDDPDVYEFYFKTRKKHFLSIHELKSLLKKKDLLIDYIIILLELNMNNCSGSFSHEEYLRLKQLKNNMALLPDILKKFSEFDAGNLKHIEFKREDETSPPKVWVSPEFAKEENIQPLIENNFYQILADPEFLEHNREDVLASINKYAWFKKAFWKKCREAENFLIKTGNSDRLHPIFKEKK
ncbi:MAG: tubulin-like doman-containing protein [Thermodesulfobacteriota bacterium]|nr:tubulin-like doman-containing protein [Thermodesulfobacteriota bacterium]